MVTFSENGKINKKGQYYINITAIRNSKKASCCMQGNHFLDKALKKKKKRKKLKVRPQKRKERKRKRKKNGGKMKREEKRGRSNPRGSLST